MSNNTKDPNKSTGFSSFNKKANAQAESNTTKAPNDDKATQDANKPSQPAEDANKKDQ